MPSTLNGHSHKPTTKSGHKPFKAGRGRNRKGKVAEERPKTPHQQVLSKLDRRNQNRQRQLEKQKEHRLEASVFSGRHAAPRNVAVIPLCRDCDVVAAVQALIGSLDIEADVGSVARGGVVRVPVDRFKQQLQYVVVPPPSTDDDANDVDDNVVASLDAARVADFVLFVLSATEEVDARGELVLRSVASQGLSTLFTVVQGLGRVEPAKQRLAVLESLRSFMRHFHPDQEKLVSLDSRPECANLMRSLCSAAPKGIHWRDERSWMLVEDVQFGGADEGAVLTGVVRGRGLKADRLVQVGDWGTFQIEKITAAPSRPATTRAPKGAAAADTMAVDDGHDGGAEAVLDTPTDDRDDLAGLAPEDAVMSGDEYDDDMNDDDGEDSRSLAATSRKGVLLDDHHYFSEDEEYMVKPARKLPAGTSEYQSAWILDDVTSESGSETDGDGDGEHGDEEAKMVGVADDDNATERADPADGMEGVANYAPTEVGGAGPSEYPASEAYVEQDDEQEAAQLAHYRAQKRTEAEDDLEFPDEIELQPHVLARERLARYRGLKSLRSSPWNEKEDRPHEPENWRRLLRIPDYRASRVRASREALKIVTIRYMFFNREDVEWFKALPLWTKRGRSGYIKECLGTHGYFKATFDGRINPQDSVGVSLYKRVWPRVAEPFQAWADAAARDAHGAEDEVDEDMT
ncbi:pre-rRNA processing protein [Niveomyces insectorum RCEF 264]|uniref:Pre-rRNA processing protein n=1 Tax=Niveomyces insectorum RCEF 264 TaxID=1081102 RepID=A0A167NU09_9HYPO|nr:pre-rRNA processing protein [Niveomyces insectorum RCEF 264]